MLLIRPAFFSVCWTFFAISDYAGDVAETPYPIPKGDWFGETDAVRWSRDRSISGEQTTLLIYGESLVGYGITDTIELQTSFFPYAVEEIAVGSVVTRSTGGGDLALRANIGMIRRDDDQFGLSLLPFVRLPTGFGELQVDRVESGLAIPLAWTFADGLELSATALIERIDAKNGGSVWVISSAISTDFRVTETFGAYVEITNVAEESDLKTWGTMVHFGAVYTINEQVGLTFGLNLGLTDPALDQEAFLRISTLW